MDPMNRRVLMIEVDDTLIEVEQRLALVLPDVVVWGEVDSCSAAMLVLDRELPVAA